MDMNSLIEDLNGRTVPGGYVGFPDGWFNIVYKLHRQLVFIDPEYRVTQVKEKFGGLRFYADTVFGSDDVRYSIFYDLISAAEYSSERVCQVCGDYGTTIFDRGWYSTLCDVHKEADRG